jgi:hypothetical protein
MDRRLVLLTLTAYPAGRGAVTDPAWQAKPSWYLVTTEDRMIPPPAQPAPFWDYQHKRQAIAPPANQQAGRPGFRSSTRA